MHPLFIQRRSLVAYLLFWAGLGVLPWFFLRSSSATGSALLALLSSLSFALLTLPSWYLCRALPLSATRASQTVITHLLAAFVWSFTWSVVFGMQAELLAFWPKWRSLPREVDAAGDGLLALGGLFYLLVVSFFYVLLGFETRRDALEREQELSLAAQRSELAALRSQIHPHFLFNSLNTLNALIGYDPAKAREACLLLADTLRGSLSIQKKPLVPVAEEWALADRYLKVEALRFGERLQLDVRVDTDAEACLIPSLLLQPLVENAVTHGVSSLDEPSSIIFRAECAANRLVLRLENSYEVTRRRPRHGLGLANVRARLAAEYGREATLRVEAEAARYVVLIDLPVRFDLAARAAALGAEASNDSEKGPFHAAR